MGVLMRFGGIPDDVRLLQMHVRGRGFDGQKGPPLTVFCKKNVVMAVHVQIHVLVYFIKTPPHQNFNPPVFLSGIFAFWLEDFCQKKERLFTSALKVLTQENQGKRNK
jgi:hypothetical protein